MLGFLKGTLRYKDLNTLLVDVGGVGYRVRVPTEATLELTPGSSVFLWTHLAVRENSLEIFGFLEKEMLDTFELLITVSGIGPKSAVGILNVASPSMLRQAVARADTSHLTRVSGIGKKNAEKIVLELKGKLELTKDDEGADLRSDEDALEALISLGYSERDSREALKKVSKEIEGASERVKAALKLLANGS